MSSARTIADQVRAGTLSAREVCEGCLARADEMDDLGAFWHLDPNAARAAADAVDATVAAGRDPGRLAGVPIAVKDAFDVAGMPGGGGGPETLPHKDAAAIARLRQEGAIVIGKLAMHQFGWGMSGQTPRRPPCRNPYALGRQPGGSSSGSAVAVAAGIVPLALGADSGGSVRVPAAWCGVVGYKPSRDAIPTGGLLPLAPTLDTVGLLAACVSDCLLADAALRGTPEHALTTLEGLRIGIERGLRERAEPAVARCVEAALSHLPKAGVDLVECSLPSRGLPLAPIYAADLAAAWKDEVQAHPDAYGEDVRQGVERGSSVLAVDYLRTVSALKQARADAKLDVDVLVCPASPILPPPFDRADDVPTAGRFTRIFNFLDWPALVLPCGSPDQPVGLQLAAPRGNESALFTLAAALEQVPTGIRD